MNKFKIVILFLLLIFLAGCSYTKEMAQADIAKNEAYGKAMTAYYENTKNMVPTKVADIQLSDDGRVKAFVVYNTNVKLPDAPKSPINNEASGVKITNSIVNSQTINSLTSFLGTGLIVKIATDGSGDRNSHNSGSNNQSGGDQNVSGAGTASLNASTTNTDDSAHSSDSSTTNIHTEEKTGSDNTQQTDVNNDKSDRSQTDVNNDKSDNSDNSDNSIDNSDNSQEDTNNNKPIDNSIDNTNQYSGGTTYEASPTP